MAVFPMEREIYSWQDNTTSLNITFRPSSFTLEERDFDWLRILALPDDNKSLLALQNASLAILVFAPLLSSSTSKRFLLPLTHFLEGTNLQVVIYILKTALGLLLMFGMTPILLPLFFFTGTSLLVRLCYFVLWGWSVKKAEGLDCIWGVEEKENKPFIIACLRLSGVADLTAVRQSIMTKILEVRDGATGGYKYNKFRQLFSQRFGYYCWRENPHFDINNHVREIDLYSFYATKTDSSDQETKKQTEDEDAKEDAKDPVAETENEEMMRDEDQDPKENDEDVRLKGVDTDELVQRYTSEELTEDMAEGIPPWEVLLLPRNDGRYNMILRIHHAIGDGVSLVRLCVEALVDTPLPPPPVGPPPPSPLVR